ncbi:MAG: hypothetical protein MZV63_12485 [Marinilabiliales bacterium]|nr:hypothetical protein [Marinilabiliales bacterium]
MTPVEVCNIFERLGIRYNDTILLAFREPRPVHEQLQGRHEPRCLRRRHGLHEDSSA